MDGEIEVEDELEALVQQANQARADMGDLRSQLRQMELDMQVNPSYYVYQSLSSRQLRCQETLPSTSPMSLSAA